MTNSIIQTFRAFRNRNYRLFFAGQSISQIGTWMQRTGVSWVIYTLTHSPFMLGLSVFAAQFPSFLFSLLGGIVSDRHNRHKLLLLTQTAAMMQAALLAILTLSNRYAVWQLLTLSVVLGVINAFDVPARQPLVHEVINDPEDLPNALALNSSMVSVARLLGPAFSGLVLVKWGAGICFLLNALSFLAVITSLLLMKLPPDRPKPARKKVRSELADGFNYLIIKPDIGLTVLMLALVSLLALPYDTLLPVFAKVIFRGDAATFGYINSFIGLGAVIGAVFLASVKPGVNYKLLLLLNTCIFGLGLMAFSQTGYFPFAMLFAVICGFGRVSITAVCNTIVQVNSDAHMRGRVMSYIAMALFGMLPLGSLLIGAVSQKIGAPDTLLAQGVIAILVAVVFSGFLRKKAVA